MIFVVNESSTDFIEKNARNSTNCIENNASKAILFMEPYWKRCKQWYPVYPPNECLSAHIACVVAFSVLRCLCGCFCIRWVAPDAVFILWRSEPDSFQVIIRYCEMMIHCQHYLSMKYSMMQLHKWNCAVLVCTREEFYVQQYQKGNELIIR